MKANNFIIFTTSVTLWFGFFSGNYLIFGVSLYPPLFISLLGYLIYLRKMSAPKFTVVFLSIVFFYMLLFLISNLYNGFSTDIFLIEFRYLLKAFFIPIGISLYALLIFKKYKISPDQISYIIIIVILLQGILAVFQLVSPIFREWFFSFLTLSEGWEYFVKIGHFRTIGLAGLSIYDTSLAYSLMFGLTVYLYIKNGYKNNFIWIFSWSIFFLLTILSGRTGMIIFSFLSIYILFNHFNKFSFLNIAIIGFILFSLLTYYISYDELMVVINFAFEIFTKSNGHLETASTNDLLENHLFLPMNVNPFFGDAIWAQPSIANELKYEYSTDSGYILSFISMGIMGLLMSIVMTYIIFKGYQIAYFSHFKKTYMNMMFIAMIFILVVGIVLKGPIFFSDKFMSILIFIFMIQHYLKGVFKIEKININSNI